MAEGQYFPALGPPKAQQAHLSSRKIVSEEAKVSSLYLALGCGATLQSRHLYIILCDIPG